MEGIQEKLPLFESPSFEDLLEPANASDLQIVEKPRLRTNWYVTMDRKSGKRKLYVPRALAEAPEHVKAAILEWAQLPWAPVKKKRKDVLAKKRALEKHIWTHLEDLGVQRSRRKYDRAQLETTTKGAVHDLAEIRDSINAGFFKGKVDTSVRWGTYASTTSFQTYVRDKRGTRFSLVTIAGVYNHPDVPRFAVEAVMYHEMLHVVVPTYKKNGRNVFHGPEFKRMERLLPQYHPWRRWEREHMGRLVRSLKMKRVWSRKKRKDQH